MARILFLVGVLIVAIAGGVWALSKNTYTIKLSAPMIEQALNTRLPLEKNYYAIFDVTVDEPRVNLIENSDRVFAGVDIVLEVAAGSRRIPVSGAVDLSGAIDYDADRAAFFLVDPRIEAMNIEGVPQRWADRSRSVVSLAIKEFYEQRPIYSLESDEMGTKAAKLVLRDVIVKDERVVVTLGLADQS